MRKTLLLIGLILLLALAFRLYNLTGIPPGLTHDEANHSREAIEILDGVYRYYFPLNYGSEPLYSYTVAGTMALLGENLFALRLVNILFGLAAIAATAVWARQAFNKETALIAAGLLAVSFWPLVSSREALRAGMLPFFMVLAVWFFWQIVCNPCGQDGDGPPASTPGRWRMAGLVIGFALSIVATFHIYLAARVAWLLFPLFLIYLALLYRDDFRRSWRPAAAGLLLAGLLLIPMFLYLANNPYAQTRLSMLSGTIDQLSAGDLLPIINNGAEALLAFIWPGYGDQFLAYNIPGRPVFDLFTAVFFIIGLIVSLWRWRQPAYAFLLLWFIIGIIPSLVTGSTASTTRNLAALPAVYLLPAVGFVFAGQTLARRLNLSQRGVLLIGAAVWLLLVAFVTGRDYFARWAAMPEVRGAYQHTLVEELQYLQDRGIKQDPVLLSTVYPGPVHDASIALVLAGQEAQNYRWVDARNALLLPAGEEAFAVIPSSTPPHGAFSEYLHQLDTVTLRADDLDPYFSFYALENSRSLTGDGEEALADFGSAVQLIDVSWIASPVQPGQTAELLTRWRVINPDNIGPAHPPAFQPDTVFFTHLLDEGENLVSQDDALDAPSWSWQVGDTILQIHRLELPAETEAGSYQPVVGIYDRQTGERLPLNDASGLTAETLFRGPLLEVARSSN
ncbi:MAG: ArnT family glycosyltransferase [Candidatus Promineifilaceae bacterium]|jgi:4-amino-4-deoxy-L-arabinose transferase-like glycosyltransferase